MKNKWLNIILIICMIIMQRVVIQMSGYEVYQLPFASTLFIFDNPTSNLVQILYAYIPLPFVLFYFSGNAREITTGYGKLWLIRSYSRERLYLKNAILSAAKLACIVIGQTIIFLICDGTWNNLSSIKLIQVIVTYFVGVWALVQLQFLLELFMDASISNIFVNVFLVVSLIIGNSVLINSELSRIGVMLFPNMLFGTRSGIIYQKNIYVRYETSIIYVIILLVVLKENTVLDNVSYTFKSGFVYGLYGQNGSGKTMLLRAISGLINLDSGSIFIDGEKLHDKIEFPPETGIVIENMELLPECSAKRNLQMLAKIKNIADEKDIIFSLERVGLDPDSDKKVKKFSLGMKQRLNIAQAIFENQKIILLDEPTNALDEDAVQLIYKIIREEKSRGATIIVATHHKEDLKEVCDVILKIAEGKIVEENENK